MRDFFDGLCEGLLERRAEGVWDLELELELELEVVMERLEDDIVLVQAGVRVGDFDVGWMSVFCLRLMAGWIESSIGLI